jgi:cytochrome b561
MTDTLSAGYTGKARYDWLTITLHWMTAGLVITLFALALIWDELPKGTPLRKGMQSWHISLGLTLVVVYTVRVLWHVIGSRRLPPAATGLQQVAAKAVHYALYALLAVQMVLGFLFRWAQGEPFSFFGLFDVPSIMAADHDMAGTYGELHETIAWIIIVLAGGHAALALLHHYVLKDGVLLRMLPFGSRR